MPQVLHSDSPLPPAAAPLRLPAARAFGASADAVHLPLALLTRLLSAQRLSGSCQACCTSAFGRMPTAPAAPAAPALPVARLPTTADGLPDLGFSNLLRPRAQSADAVRHALRCTLL